MVRSSCPGLVCLRPKGLLEGRGRTVRACGGAIERLGVRDENREGSQNGTAEGHYRQDGSTSTIGAIATRLKVPERGKSPGGRDCPARRHSRSVAVDASLRGRPDPPLHDEVRTHLSTSIRWIDLQPTASAICASCTGDPCRSRPRSILVAMSILLQHVRHRDR